MTIEEYLTIEARLREKRGKKNHTNRSATGVAVLEQGQRLPLDKVPAGPRSVEGRCRLVITSYRRRLLDYDNVSTKFTIDALRHNGIIPDDNPAIVTALEIRQVKITKDETPKTVIEIIEL